MKAMTLIKTAGKAEVAKGFFGPTAKNIKDSAVSAAKSLGRGAVEAGKGIYQKGIKPSGAPIKEAYKGLTPGAKNTLKGVAGLGLAGGAYKAFSGGNKETENYYQS